MDASDKPVEVKRFLGRDFVSLDDYRIMSAKLASARSMATDIEKDAARFRWLIGRIMPFEMANITGRECVCTSDKLPALDAAIAASGERTGE